MFCKNKLLAVSLFCFISFLSLVYFNYLKAQRDIQATRPSFQLNELISYPEKIKAGSTGAFVWNVDAPPDLSTSFTTIYWGEISTPSALTESDSPEAVGYPNFQLDYTSGSFKLPNAFSLNILFDKPGNVWFRSYARVKGKHLWSAERSLGVEK